LTGIPTMMRLVCDSFPIFLAPFLSTWGFPRDFYSSEYWYFSRTRISCSNAFNAITLLKGHATRCTIFCDFFRMIYLRRMRSPWAGVGYSCPYDQLSWVPPVPLIPRDPIIHCPGMFLLEYSLPDESTMHLS